VSLESKAFIKKMGIRPEWNEGDAAIRKEKLDLLKQATTAHSQYTALAAQAKGVDRHLFGLSMLIGDDEAVPAIYSDPVFEKSKRWRVSTSHLTHPDFVNWGFGQVVPDGVGIGYSIHPRSCIFNITALEETNWAQHLCELLEEALLEIQRLVEMDQRSKAKLPSVGFYQNGKTSKDPI
jgi:carnitine O-acetyltransferase